MKYLIFFFGLLLIMQALHAQDLNQLKFRDFPVIENLDSLEKTVELQKNNPHKYLAGLVMLENSRDWSGSQKFGNYLPSIDSLSRRYNLFNIQAFCLVLKSAYINASGHERVKALEYINKALDIFIRLNDTSGIIICYSKLSYLNVSGFGRVQGSPEMAKMYSQKMLALADKSNWPGDKLLAANHRVNQYASFFQQHPDSLICLVQQSLLLIKVNPQFDYYRPEQFNTLAIAYGYKKDYKRALEAQRECLRIIPNQWIDLRGMLNYNIGLSYYDLDKFDSADIYLKESVRLELLSKTPARLRVEAVFTLGESQFCQNKFKEACQNFITADSLKNIMQADFRTTEFLELQTKYETEKKERANQVLQKEKHTYETAIIIAVVLLSTISVLLFYLFKKNKQLDEYAQFRDQIFAIISHDLRSPVMALEGLSRQASYLIKQGETDTLEQVGQKLDSTALQMNNLLNNLLAWAISKNTKIDTGMETLQLLPLVNNIALLYNEIADVKKLCIEVSIDERILVKANRNGLNVIIRNLIDNAVKNSTAGVVSITAATEKNHLVLKVINNNVITSQEMIYRIKNQLKGIKADYLKTASGFGLQLVAHFTRLHKGSIVMESDQQAGTVFTLVLPS